MYDLGDVVPLTVTVKDQNGIASNASSVSLTVTRPDGTLETFPSITGSTGVYSYDYVPAVEGRHAYRWVATGTNASAYGDTFDVRAAFTGIVSLSDTKAHLRVTSTGNDEKLRLFIESASSAVEAIVGPVVPRTVIDVFSGYSTAVILRQTPVLSVTSVVERGATLTTATDITFDADTGVLSRMWAPWYGGRFLYGYRDLVVTYVAGRAVVPPAVRLATLEVVRDLWESQRSASVGPPVGGDDTSPAEMSWGTRRRVEMLLEPLRKMPGIA